MDSTQNSSVDEIGKPTRIDKIIAIIVVILFIVEMIWAISNDADLFDAPAYILIPELILLAYLVFRIIQIKSYKVKNNKRILFLYAIYFIVLIIGMSLFAYFKYLN